MKAPNHSLIISENSAGGRTWAIACRGVDADCASYKLCEVPECAVQRGADEDAYYEALEKTAGIAHDVTHRLIESGNDEEWMVSTGACWYAGAVSTDQIATGHKEYAGGGHLDLGEYPVSCSGPGEYDDEPEFFVVDHPASIFTSTGKPRAEASR